MGPVLNLKMKAEEFEERMTVKMIIGLIIKALLKSKIVIISNLFIVSNYCTMKNLRCLDSDVNETF